VFGKYGLELREGGIEIFDTFIYESSPDTLGLAVAIHLHPHAKEENAKEQYLEHDALEKRLDFSFSAYGGASYATICVHHPEEEMIVREIEELSEKYNNIKLPEKVIRQINKSWDKNKIKVYAPLEDWAEEFVRNFSQYLPGAKPDNK
jgi:Holliday junction resolvase